MCITNCILELALFTLLKIAFYININNFVCLLLDSS